MLRIRPFPARAFTLIELLVVLGIVSVLALIGAQIMGKLMKSSREVEGLANLRQIGTTVATFMAEHENRFPQGLYVNTAGSSFSDWALFLSARYLEPHPRFDYLGGAQRSTIFKDPAAIFPDRGSLHFAANPLLFGNTGDLVVAASVPRPAQTVMAMDAGQQPASGSSYARAANIPHIFSEPTQARWNQPVPITVGNNADTDFGAGSVRWRARNGRAAKFLFVDGHVELLEKGELLYRNVWISEP